MGIVWESYHKGIPCPWESLESPLMFFVCWVVVSLLVFFCVLLFQKRFPVVVFFVQ